MKRFYKEVSIRESKNGCSIELDGKPVKTPGGNLLEVKDKISQLIAEEWRDQKETINPLVMPVNQFVMTAIDAIRPREQIIDHILSFIDTDLVFYHSATEPYKTKQNESWGKWVSVAEKRSNVKLKVTSQIERLSQDICFSGYIKEYLERLEDLYLIVFESIVDETSSVVLAYAMFDKAASAEDIFQAVFVEDMIRAEIYNEELYGAAPDQEKKRKSLLLNLKAAEKLIALF